MKLHEMDLTKKIRRMCHYKGYYMQIDNNGFFFGEDCKHPLFTADNIKADDWEYFEEPKKKVKMWPALCKSLINFQYFITEGLYKSEEEARKKCVGNFVRLLTELPAIEVEE